MDYFIMKTDRRLRLLPQIQFSKEGIGTNVMKQSIAYVKEYTGRCIDYPDYLEKPYPLIADKYRKILQKYQQDMDLQRVMLIEKRKWKANAVLFDTSGRDCMCRFKSVPI